MEPPKPVAELRVWGSPNRDGPLLRHAGFDIILGLGGGPGPWSVSISCVQCHEDDDEDDDDDDLVRRSRGPSRAHREGLRRPRVKASRCSARLATPDSSWKPCWKPVHAERQRSHAWKRASISTMLVTLGRKPKSNCARVKFICGLQSSVGRSKHLDCQNTMSEICLVVRLKVSGRWMS